MTFKDYAELWGKNCAKTIEDTVRAGKRALKPCPICGGEAEVVAFYIQGIANRLNYFVRCKQNGCKRTRSYRRKERAVSAWNEMEREQE